VKNTMPKSELPQDVYDQLNARFDADPASLSRNESAMLFLARFKVILGQEAALKGVSKAVKDRLQRAYTKACRLLVRHEKGTCDGQVPPDLAKIIPMDAALTVLRVVEEDIARRLSNAIRGLM
jgi:hypothetical protein